MFIQSIDFHNFKNLNGSFALKNGINLLIKENGWGKTNFLESIDYISNLKSFRSIPDQKLFSWGENGDFFKISLELDGLNRKNLQAVISKTENGSKTKRVFIDEVATNFKKFKSSIETLLYSPHNADIVSSSPEIRRNEFDRMIGQFDGGYQDLINEYKFVVKSKNKILQKLKGNGGQKNELDYWNEKLVSLGQDIIERRVVFLVELAEYLQNYADEIFSNGKHDLKVEYSSRVLDDKEITLQEKIEFNQDKEIQAGMSLYGPHRDKFIFVLNGKPMREFGSRGQQRLAGLCMMFSLYDYFKRKLERAPILLLDDIVSELDRSHRKSVEKIITKNIDSQAFITSSEKSYFSSSFVKKCNLL